MKNCFIILLSILVSLTGLAQSPGKGYWKSVLSRGQTDTVPGIYWLIITNEPVQLVISPYRQVKTMRQFSNNEAIVTAENMELLTHIPGIEYSMKANDYWKLSPSLLDAVLTNNVSENNTTRFYITTESPSVLLSAYNKQKSEVNIIHQYGNVLLVETSFDVIKKDFLSNNAITSISFANRSAKEEVSITGFDNSTNAVNKIHSNYLQYNGSGITVSIKENKPDTTDIDFKGRYLTTSLTSNNQSTHATIMSTIIAGGGNSSYTAKGVAWGGKISSSSFTVLLPENDAAYRLYNISVQNHSYGTGIENFYGADALAYDSSVMSNPYLLHVFSLGNSGNLASSSGAYSGILGFANLTGSFKMAKNIITVGSVDSFYTIPLLSSKGPAFDGRVKPELVAFGEDGSSGAAALVSGTALVLQQLYKSIHADSLPDVFLTKAVLLNSADDVGSKGIDYSSGYGNLNAYKALQDIQSNRIIHGAVSNGQIQSFPITVPANAVNLKVLLCWSDKPTSVNNFIALVNDLDITLTHNASNQSYQPWVLNSAANPDSLILLPVRKRDSLNPVEQITLDNPTAGDYTITLKGFSIPNGSQSFNIVYRWDIASDFQWYYPTVKDNLVPNQQNVLRWRNTYTSNGLLEYKYAGNNNWQSINSNIVLTNKYFKWTVPDTTAVIQLRMTINGTEYISDTVTLSAKLQTGVGFNCPDSVLLYWNKTNAAGYTVFQLDDKYMQPYMNTIDTEVVLKKNNLSEQWFAVAAQLPFNKTGTKGFALNYTSQGVGCYIKSFTADLINNSAQVYLELGTNYFVKNVSIEKLGTNGYISLQTYNSPVSLDYTLVDNSITKGVITYRVKIELSNGRIIYSEPETIYFLNNNKYLVYPNPVSQQGSINIIATTLNNPLFQLYNIYGQKLAEKTLTNLTEQIPAARFGKGLYYYIIWNNGVKDAAGKIIIQ